MRVLISTVCYGIMKAIQEGIRMIYMKKTMLLCVLMLALVLLLAGCSCKHEWTAATCDAPKTCNLCGKTEGVALGHIWQEATCQSPKTCSACQATEGEKGDHSWVDANCSSPKTCSVCQATEGELGGHVWQDATCAAPKTCAVCRETEGAKGDHVWQEATCKDPKTCSVCQLTEGEPGDHVWEEATCAAPKTCSACQLTEGEKGDHKWEEATTEAPKTCSICKETSGKKLVTDYRFTTASTKVLQGAWTCDVVVTGEMVDLEDFGGVDCVATLTFGNTGIVTMVPQIKDEAGAMARYRTYSIDKLYAQYAADGMSKAEADQDMLKEYGYNVPDYVDSVLKDINVKDMVAKYGFTRVYYVENGVAYIGDSWTSSFESHGFSLSGSKLVINGVSLTEGGETLVWTR